MSITQGWGQSKPMWLCAQRPLAILPVVVIVAAVMVFAQGCAAAAEPGLPSALLGNEAASWSLLAAEPASNVGRVPRSAAVVVDRGNPPAVTVATQPGGGSDGFSLSSLIRAIPIVGEFLAPEPMAQPVAQAPRAAAGDVDSDARRPDVGPQFGSELIPAHPQTEPAQSMDFSQAPPLPQLSS